MLIWTVFAIHNRNRTFTHKSIWDSNLQCNKIMDLFYIHCFHFEQLKWHTALATNLQKMKIDFNCWSYCFLNFDHFNDSLKLLFVNLSLSICVCVLFLSLFSMYPFFIRMTFYIFWHFLLQLCLIFLPPCLKNREFILVFRFVRRKFHIEYSRNPNNMVKNMNFPEWIINKPKYKPYQFPKTK